MILYYSEQSTHSIHFFSLQRKRYFLNGSGDCEVVLLQLGIFICQKLLTSSQLNLGQKPIYAREAFRPCSNGMDTLQISTLQQPTGRLPDHKFQPFSITGHNRKWCIYCLTLNVLEKKHTETSTHSSARSFLELPRKSYQKEIEWKQQNIF